MVLTVNIGNTHISVGGYDGQQKLFSGRLSARAGLTADECAIALGQLLELYGHGGRRWEGAILGSVAPALTAPMIAALRRYSQGRVLTVGPGLKSGLAICIDDPGQLGAELLCAGVAALDLAPGPVILLCADTALSLMGIDEKGRLLGGMILPGPKAALNALVKGTAQLPQVDLDTPRAALTPLAKNSAACLQAGSILGTAAMLDGLIARLRSELGDGAWVAATGEVPEAVLKAMSQPVRRCEDLILDGMYLIWQKNQK